VGRPTLASFSVIRIGRSRSSGFASRDDVLDLIETSKAMGQAQGKEDLHCPTVGDQWTLIQRSRQRRIGENNGGNGLPVVNDALPQEKPPEPFTHARHIFVKQGKETTKLDIAEGLHRIKLSQFFINNGINVETECDQGGTCGTCRAQIDIEDIGKFVRSKPKTAETLNFKKEGLQFDTGQKGDWRQTCGIGINYVGGDVVFVLPEYK